MNSWERRVLADRAVSNLVRMAQEATSDDLSRSEQDGLLRFEAAIAERRVLRRPRSNRTWRIGLAGFGVAAAAAAIALFVNYRSSVQAFEVANGSVSSGG